MFLCIKIEQGIRLRRFLHGENNPHQPRSFTPSALKTANLALEELDYLSTDRAQHPSQHSNAAPSHKKGDQTGGESTKEVVQMAHVDKE
ncbi:hypothetical protein N7470_002305 [Penicillium chermesinum]|nr:hypothetical protein N7470_002305 [Penicillium chermesinum]